MSTQWGWETRTSHKRALNCAATTSPGKLYQIRELIDRLVATGASHHEAETALHNLFGPDRTTLLESS